MHEYTAIFSHIYKMLRILDGELKINGLIMPVAADISQK